MALERPPLLPVDDGGGITGLFSLGGGFNGSRFVLNFADGGREDDFSGIPIEKSLLVKLTAVLLPEDNLPSSSL